MSIEDQIQSAEASAAQFQAVWQQQVLPQLGKFNGQVPAQFVIDVVDAIDKNIAAPFVDAKENMQSRLMSASVGSYILGAIGFGNVTNKQFVDVASNLVEQSGTVLRGIVVNTLRPFAAFAKQQVSQVGRRAMVKINPISTPEFSTFTAFDVLVVESLQAGADALRTLQVADQIANTSPMFTLADLIDSAAETVLKALAELLKFIASLGKALYNAAGTIFTLLKVGLIVGIGYVGYTVYKDQQGKTQNPARRRRRRARRRLHA